VKDNKHTQTKIIIIIIINSILKTRNLPLLTYDYPICNKSNMHIGLMHEKLKRTKKGGYKMLTLRQETKNCTTPKLDGTHPNLCS
jgi:hypothetical protein